MNKTSLTSIRAPSLAIALMLIGAGASYAQPQAKTATVSLKEYEVVPVSYTAMPSDAAALERRLDELEEARSAMHKRVAEFLDKIYSAISEGRAAEVAKYFPKKVTATKNWHEKVVEEENYQSIEIYSIRPDAGRKVVEVRCVLRTLGQSGAGENRYLMAKLVPDGQSYRIMNTSTDIGLDAGLFSMAPEWPRFRYVGGSKSVKVPTLPPAKALKEMVKAFVGRFYSDLESGNYYLAEALVDDRLFEGKTPYEWDRYYEKREGAKPYVIFGIRKLDDGTISVRLEIQGDRYTFILRPDMNTGFKFVNTSDRWTAYPPDEINEADMVTSDELLSLGKARVAGFIDETFRMIDRGNYVEAEEHVSTSILNQIIELTDDWEFFLFERGSLVRFVTGTIKLDDHGRRVEIRGRLDTTHRRSIDEYYVFAQLEYSRSKGFRIVHILKDSSTSDLPGPATDYPKPREIGDK